MPPERYDLDLGHDHWAQFFVWDPDPELNPHLTDLPGSPDEPVGCIVYHPRSNGEYCSGAIHFDTPRTARMQETNRWQLVSLDPLHVEPSILCKTCGDHGFIRNGRWESA